MSFCLACRRVDRCATSFGGSSLPPDAESPTQDVALNVYHRELASPFTLYLKSDDGDVPRFVALA